MNGHEPNVTEFADESTGGREPRPWSRRAMLSALTAGAAGPWLGGGLPASAGSSSRDRAVAAAASDDHAWDAQTVVTGAVMIHEAPAPYWTGHRVEFGRALKQPVRVFATIHNDDDRVRNVSVRNITATGADIGCWGTEGTSNRLVQWLAVGADHPFLSGAGVLRARPDGSAHTRQPWGARLGREPVPHAIATGVSGSGELLNVVIEPRLTNRRQVGFGLSSQTPTPTTVQWLGVRESMATDTVATGAVTLTPEPELFRGVPIEFGRRLPSPVRVFVTAVDARGSVLNAAVDEVSDTGAVVGVVGSTQTRAGGEEINVNWVALGGADVPYADRPPFTGDVIAHRGRNSRVPENLIGSLDGLDPWVDGVEFDARLTADGVAVVMHDSTVDRTTDGTGEVADLTLRRIKELDASGEQVPTVAEYLRACAGRGFSRILIDMKVESVAAIRAVVEAIEDSSVKDSCMILSSAARRRDGDDDGGENLRKVSPAIRLGSLGGGVGNVDEVLTWCDRYDGGLVLLMPNAYLAHRSTVPVITAAGVEPAASTINDESSLRAAREDGVALVLTDTSDVLEDF